jgi:hypothetical protein
VSAGTLTLLVVLAIVVVFGAAVLIAFLPVLDRLREIATVLPR